MLILWHAYVYTFSKLSEHHTLRGDLKIPIAVYEKEPSSVIAYTLSSGVYARELAKLQSMDKGNRKGLIMSNNKVEESGWTLTDMSGNMMPKTGSSNNLIGIDAGAGGAILVISWLASFSVLLLNL